MVAMTMSPPFGQFSPCMTGNEVIVMESAYFNGCMAGIMECMFVKGTKPCVLMSKVHGGFEVRGTLLLVVLTAHYNIIV